MDKNAEDYYKFGKKVREDAEKEVDFIDGIDYNYDMIEECKSLLRTAADSLKKALRLDPENLSYYDEIINIFRELIKVDASARMELSLWYEISIDRHLKEAAKPLKNMDKYERLAAIIKDEKKERGFFARQWRKWTYRRPKLEKTKPSVYGKCVEEYRKKTLKQIFEEIAIKRRAFEKADSGEKWTSLDRYSKERGMAAPVDVLRRMKETEDSTMPEEYAKEFFLRYNKVKEE
jgi:hypothetical protein